MTDELYKIIGVSRDASQDEIRKTYRKRAKELHPDLHPGDMESESRFKAVAAAYDILGDREKRARYDRGEIDASGAERPEHTFYRQYADSGRAGRYTSSAGSEDLGDISDLFADLFGHGAKGSGAGGQTAFRMRGQDVRYDLDVDFLDAVNGAKRRVTLADGGTLDLTIPAGTRDGTVLRLKGRGHSGLGGGPAGDALVGVRVRDHAVFRREGDDIVMTLPITLKEAVCGGKVTVPTVTGRVTMTVPKGSSSGDVLRLKGKGVAPAKGAPAGDQRVELRVSLPKSPDADLERLVSEWETAHPYDPRADQGRA